MSKADATLQGFHMLTGVTMDAINVQFQWLYETTESLQSFQFIFPGKTSVFMDVKLGPCSVKAVEGDDERLLFMIPLTSGWLICYDVTEFPAVPMRYDVDNWKLAFAVDLASTKLNGSLDGKLGYIKQRLDNSGICKPGDYSIQKLFLDFTSVDLANYDVKDSDLGELDEQDSEHISAKAAFTIYMNTYVLKLAVANPSDGSEPSILGYVPLINTPSVVPTVIPTSMHFQTYPQNSNGISDPTKNALLYLEMTQGVPLPGTQLVYSANWVDDTVHGCAALSKNIFLDGYLMPELNRINVFTFVRASLATITGIFDSTFTYAFATDIPEDVAAVFTYQGIDNGDHLYQFENHSIKEADATLGKLKVKGNVVNTVRIPIASSTCVIKVEGSTLISLEIYAWPTEVVYSSNLTWSGGFILQEVDSDGKLVMVEDGLPISNVQNNKTTWALGDSVLSGPDIGKVLDMEVTTLDISGKIDSMNTVFNGSYPFYFGQGQEFLMKRPQFNKEGDLTLDLVYKNI